MSITSGLLVPGHYPVVLFTIPIADFNGLYHSVLIGFSECLNRMG